jgi:U3 small nucleolar RNA-associated protein 3
MGKKRKASGRQSKPTGPKEFDEADARLGPIGTYEDVANSEDEYFINQEKILLEDEPQSKRRRKLEEEAAFLDNSEEEILDSDEEEPEDDEDEEDSMALKGSHSRSKAGEDEEESGEEKDEEGQDLAWWGSAKKEYYDADNIETEADALEEEAEAKRIQEKKLSKMTDEDFLFDEDEWATTKRDAGAGTGEGVVTEVLADMKISDDMSPEERYKLLQTRYPEFEHLVTEFEELQPVLEVLRIGAAGKAAKSIEAVKYWILGCYLAAIASYFAILTSPARDGEGTSKALNPAELRDHDVMETLVTCRETWNKVKDLSAAKTATSLDEAPSIADDKDAPLDADAQPRLSREDIKRERKKAKAKKAEKLRAREVEKSLADLSALIKPSKKSSKSKVPTVVQDEGEFSDFGEEEVLDARRAADKAARKKSLRFYTSQIVQKSNRRADASRDAGGDHDIPYRERLRDRQLRLNAEAERRGKKDSKLGADLDDRDDDDANATATAIRDNEDEYYDMVANLSRKKKADKAAKYEAIAAASKKDRIVENQVVGEDGKRKVTYAIEKNKGLAPKRKKEVRNPRVKKRMKYEEKQKKLRSMKATYKGGEGPGGYGGELTGINTNIVKSRKL